MLLFFTFSFLDQTNSRQNLVFNMDRSQAHLALIFLDVFMLVYIVTHYRYLRILDNIAFLLIGIAVWVFVVDRINEVPFSSGMVRQSMTIAWALVYLFFKIYMQSGDNEKSINFFIFCQYIFFSCIFLYYSFSILSQWNRQQVLQCITNVVVLMPWLVLWLREKKQRNALLLTVLLVFISFKRSSIIAAIAMLSVAMFSGKEKTVKKVGLFIFAIIATIVLFVLVDNWSGGYLFGRFQGENFITGAGRIDIYRAGIEDIGRRNVLMLLIGEGSASAVSKIGTGLHNDWLDFLFSYGIVGVVLFALLVKNCFAKIRLLEDSPIKKRSAGMMIALFFVLSMLSTVYFAYIAFQVFGFYGVLEGYNDYERNQQ